MSYIRLYSGEIVLYSGCQPSFAYVTLGCQCPSCLPTFATCGKCSDLTSDWTADLGGGGWANRNVPSCQGTSCGCEQFFGKYLLANTGVGECVWRCYIVDYCTFGAVSCHTSLRIELEFIRTDPGLNENYGYWQLKVQYYDMVQTGTTFGWEAIYQSDTKKCSGGPGCPWRDPATGKIALHKVSEGVPAWLAEPKEPLCSGSLPQTVYIWRGSDGARCSAPGTGCQNYCSHVCTDIGGGLYAWDISDGSGCYAEGCYCMDPSDPNFPCGVCDASNTGTQCDAPCVDYV